MARQQLPLGQIQPAARPVSSFVRPGLVQPAAPARPEMVQISSDRIGLVQTAGSQNIAGYNQGEQLARALAPFSENLTKLLNYGAQLYASNEYRQGQNEALKAYSQANNQMLASANEYAAENRALERKDPMAALLMDRANPFRAAGRQNQLSQLAAREIPLTMRRAFLAQRYDLATVDPTDPRINEVKANALAQGLQKFGLDEFTPGVIDFVMPRVNAEWDKITRDQVDDHNKYLDDMGPRIAANELYGIIAEGRRRNLSAVQIVSSMGLYLDNHARTYGLGGKGQQMKQEAIERALLMVDGSNGQAVDARAAEMLMQIPVGPPEAGGVRRSYSELYAQEELERQDRFGEIVYRRNKRQQEQVAQGYADAVADAVYGMEDGPEKAARLAEIREQFREALPASERFRIEREMSSVTEDVAARGYSSDGFDAFLQRADAAYGNDWNPQEWDQQLNIELDKVAPQDRARRRQEYAALRRRKEDQKRSMPDGLITGAINRQVKANLEAKYPDMQTAAMRNARNIQEIMAVGDANSAASASRQNAAFREAIYTAIDAKRAELDRDLTPTEFQRVIDQTLNGFEKNAPATWKTLFPGIGDQPSTVPLQQRRPDPAKPEPPKPPAGRRAQQAPTFRVAQLDTMPDRERRLQNWRAEAVLSASEVARLLPMALNGQALPAPLTRAAKSAGTSPQQLLLQQADFYPNDITLTPAQRAKLGRSGQQASSTQRYQQQVAMAMQSESPSARAARWLMDALTGTAPAYAGSRQNFSAAAVARSSGPVNLDRLREAIVGKESGGRFNAVNPDSGALGIGQVMPANVGPWTKKHYGQRLTPQQFLSNRNAQIAVVNGQLNEILQQQIRAGYDMATAIRRTASIWYSGRGDLYNDSRPQYSNGRRYPSIREYTTDILNRYQRRS